MSITENTQTEVIFCHLLNDASGSPRVLLAAIHALRSEKRPTKLFVGSDGNGVLEGCGIPITKYWYFRSAFKIVTLFSLLLSQILLFSKLLMDRSISKTAIIYINTLLPFGGAIFGRVTGRKVIYHIHEISLKPRPLRMFLCWIARLTSAKNIYVSKAHSLALPIAPTPAVQIYNTLDEKFAAIALHSPYQHRRNGNFNVLMIASLRDYKGVPEFLALASALEQRVDIRFDLVVNDDQEAIFRYFLDKKIPNGVKVHPRTSDPAQFYQCASLLLNLSRIDMCVETFGLTILEAMAFGIPVIVPTAGGPAELVNDQVQGFVVDCRNAALLKKRVLAIADDRDRCNVMSEAARRRALDFTAQSFSAALRQVVLEVNQ